MKIRKYCLFIVLACLPGIASAAEREICVDRVCSFDSVAEAFSAARDNSLITISGEWNNGGVLSASGVTVRGIKEAHLRGGAVQGKAGIVVAGDNTRIENLECSEMTVPDQNGACIRQEGKNLTLVDVYFHDNQNGILTTSDVGLVRIEDSTFERNGYNGGGGYAHGIYVNGGDTELFVTNSRFVRTKLGGHAIKSRAAKTTIQNSVIATLDGVDSRSIDIPNGGEVIIRNNVIEQGPASENRNSIGIGLEGVEYQNNTVRIENNYIILERNGSNVLLDTAGIPEPVVTGNTIVGGDKIGGSNSWYATREEAKIAAFPYLPESSAPGSVSTTTPVSAALQTNFMFRTYLTIGSRGNEVSQLQRVLASYGLFNHEVTGYFGPITSAAVAAFQVRNNIEAVGVVGPLTRAVLNAL